MKKFISFIALFATLVTTAIAQPSADLFKQLLQLSGQMETMIDQSPETIDQFVMVAKMSNPSLSEDDAKAKIEKYLKGAFFDDMTELSRQYYTTLTDADCKVLVKELGKSELQESMKRITTSAAKSEKQMSANISSAMQQLMMGTTPEVPIYNEAPASLIKKFEEYADLIALESTIDGALNSVKQQMSALMPANMKEQMDKTFNGAFTYLRTSIRPITFNLMSESVTEQDLQRYIDIYSTPAGQHMIEGNKAMSADVMTFSMGFMQKMMENLK